MTKQTLSVVVIGRNEGPRLVRCLESVRKISLAAEVELIYVDSASSDASAATASDLGVKVLQIQGGRMSAARARNAGWQAASSPFILFLDGDTVLHPDFVTKALAEFENEKVMVVWGHRREIYPEKSIFNRVLDLNWISPPGLTEFCGGDSLMRRSALEQAGGFNPELIAGEEPDLCRRIRATGGLISHIDEPMTGHDFAMMSWFQYWRHSFRAGHAYAEIADLYKNTNDPLWSGAVRSNAMHAWIYLLAPMVAILAAVLTRSWIFIWVPLLGFALIIARTAWKARSKQASAWTLILFALHSHVQHIPIFMGQLRYRRNAKRQWRSELIEYK